MYVILCSCTCVISIDLARIAIKKSMKVFGYNENNKFTF